MKLDLPVPDHTTISKRMMSMKTQVEKKEQHGSLNILIDSSGLKFYGEGEWNRTK